MVSFQVPPSFDTWSARISCIVSIIIVIILFFHQKYKLQERRKNAHNHNHQRCSVFSLFTSDTEHHQIAWSLVSSYLLLLSSILTLLFCILIAWTDSLTSYPIYYKYASHSIALGYALSKFFLYILLSYRIEESFIHSSYSYNKAFIWLWRLFLFGGVGIFISTYLLHTQIHGTRTTYPSWLLIYAVLFDFFACLVNLILFTRQLWLFTQDWNDNISDSSTVYSCMEEFKTIIKKQMLLAMISIVSTVLSLLTMMMVGVAVFCVSFDLCITNICVVLMFSWNSKYFLCCCKCFDTLINDSMIESIALSRVSTSRLSKTIKVGQNIAKVPPTPSFTPCMNKIQNVKIPSHSLAVPSTSFSLEVSAETNANKQGISQQKIDGMLTINIDEKREGSWNVAYSNQTTPDSMTVSPSTKSYVATPIQCSTEMRLDGIEEHGASCESCEEEEEMEEVP